MPKLPRVTSEEMVRALLKAGFTKDRQKGSHLTLLHPDTHRRAVVPMHGRVLKAGLTHGLLKQAGLTADDLRRLLE